MENLNLYQKLHEIQRKVKGLGKDKDGSSYRYVTGSKVLDVIKPLMNELGLILKQEVLSIENERMDYLVSLNYDKDTKLFSGGKPKSEILSKVMQRFTWIDIETGEKDENLFGANGQNDWDKGVGSALTYAERYFLLKYFHIPTDEDDIDNSLRDSKIEELIGEIDNLEDLVELSTKLTAQQVKTFAKVFKERKLALTPKQPEKWLTEDSPEWEKLVEAVEAGNEFTLESIKKKYKVRPETIKKLETLNIF